MMQCSFRNLHALRKLVLPAALMLALSACQ